MEPQKSANSQSNPEEDQQSWRCQHSDSKLYFKAIISKQCNTWGKRHIDQRNGIGSPEINPYLHGQLIYNKEGETIQWGEDNFFYK